MCEANASIVVTWVLPEELFVGILSISIVVLPGEHLSQIKLNLGVIGVRLEPLFVSGFGLWQEIRFFAFFGALQNFVARKRIHLRRQNKDGCSEKKSSAL